MNTAFAFFCGTPLQIFNVVNFVMNDMMGSKSCSDMYVSGKFQNVCEVVERLRDLKIFRDVYYIEGMTPTIYRFHKLYILKCLLFPKFELKHHTVPIITFDKQYSYVFASNVLLEPLCAFRTFRFEEFMGFEDGLISYNGDLFADHNSIILKLVDAIIFQRKLLRSPKRLYLNSPDFHEGNISCEICGLPEIKTTGSVYEALKQIFQYQKNALYRTHKVVYLTQPSNPKERILHDKEQEVLRILQGTDENLLIRVHPRHSADHYAGYDIDAINNLWELECVEQISDENTLIAIGSSAQIYPKLLFDKEPRLIFLYVLLMDHNNNANYISVRNIAEKMKKIYRSPEKIFIPQTVDEFKEIVANILRI